jgi:hypothetical protein
MDLDNFQEIFGISAYIKGFSKLPSLAPVSRISTFSYQKVLKKSVCAFQV